MSEGRYGIEPDECEEHHTGGAEDTHDTAYGCVTPSCVVGLITMRTMETLVTTIRLLTHADSCVPRRSSKVIRKRMAIAGRLVIPLAPGVSIMVSPR